MNRNTTSCLFTHMIIKFSARYKFIMVQKITVTNCSNRETCSLLALFTLNKVAMCRPQVYGIEE